MKRSWGQATSTGRWHALRPYKRTVWRDQVAVAELIETMCGRFIRVTQWRPHGGIPTHADATVCAACQRRSESEQPSPVVAELLDGARS